MRWNLEIKIIQVQIQARYWMHWNLKQNVLDMEIQLFKTFQKQDHQMIKFRCACFCWKYAPWEMQNIPLYHYDKDFLLNLQRLKFGFLLGSPGFQLVDLAG